MSDPTLTAVDPLRVIEGGRLWLRGNSLPLPSNPGDGCTIGGRAARVVFAATDRIAVEIPAGLDGGRTEVKVPWLPGATLYVEVGTVLATGLHQVDNPVVDSSGRVYVTYSGSRGQQAAVSIFRVTPGGAREPFVSGIVNATSMTFSPAGQLYVSSRFEGAVYRVNGDGTHERIASDLGVACGLAFDATGTLYVGDRSGTIFRVIDGKTEPFATLPASVAAFHLAIGPNGDLFVSAPTLASYDHVYRIDRDGGVRSLLTPFGRPQGLAFSPDEGVLHVVDALAGGSGVYRLPDLDGEPELVASGPGFVGVAFGPGGEMAVTSNETVYRFD